jgi:hypothetical protein
MSILGTALVHVCRVEGLSMEDLCEILRHSPFARAGFEDEDQLAPFLDNLAEGGSWPLDWKLAQLFIDAVAEGVHPIAADDVLIAMAKDAVEEVMPGASVYLRRMSFE